MSGKVVDRTDGKLVHLDGLNFSRAWALYNIATRSHMLSLPGRSIPHFKTFKESRSRFRGINSASLCCLGRICRRLWTLNDFDVDMGHGHLDFNLFPNRFQESIFHPLTRLQIPALAGRYDNPIPTRFLAPIDCLKIPVL